MLLRMLLAEYLNLTVESYYQVTIGKRQSYYFPKSKEKLAYEVFYHYTYHSEFIESVTLSILVEKNIV